MAKSLRLLMTVVLIATSLGATLGSGSVAASDEPQVRAGSDHPPVYSNGCHAGNSRSVPKACIFGTTGSKKSVLLFGDSHAAHWFGAVRATANSEKYRMVYLTKSACPSVDVRVRLYRQSRAHTTCHKWRPRALKGISQKRWGKVDVAVISNFHRHQIMRGKRVLKGKARAKAWQSGMIRTLKVLRKHAKEVVILRDSPQFPGGVAGYQRCVRKNAKNPRRCGTSTKKALPSSLWRVERTVAKRYKNVTAIDLSTPFCGGSFCSPAKAGMVAFRDDNHFGHAFMSREMTKVLRPHIVAAMTRAVGTD